MSRLIVKNLPKKITEEEIHEHFSKVGALTDVKLKYKDGKFRRFCFIGYENSEDALKALEHFHDTYFKQSKITVESSRNLEKEALPVKKNETSDKNNNGELKSSKTTKDYQKHLDNPEFQDYLNLNNKKVDTSVKEHLDSDAEEVLASNDIEEAGEKLAKNKAVSDLEYLKNLKKVSSSNLEKPKKWLSLFTVKIRPMDKVLGKSDKSRHFTKKSIKEFLKPAKYQSLRIPRSTPFIAYAGFEEEKLMTHTLNKDKSFINGIRVHIHKYEKPLDEEDASSHNAGIAPWSSAEQRLKASADPVGDSGKLFVRNLWYSMTEDHLRELFESIGPVADITLPLCKTTRKCKGFAHVSFVFPEHAVKAMNDLDGTSFKGRILHILPSINNKETEESGGTKTFKDKKLKEAKESSSSWHNWNMLFLSSSAVINVMSQQYDISKQELLANENRAQSAAVNLALGEAEIVNETKRFLEEEGVSLAAFENPAVQRSNTILLAKNLPANTTAQELREIFGKHGELGKVVLPPYGVTAIISFLDPGEAKTGFKKLAYSRFKYSPLYLEWAPVDTLSINSKKTPLTKEISPEKIVEGKIDSSKNTNKDETSIPQNENDATPNIIPQANTTIYVKNLSFDTTEDALKKHFGQCGEVYSALIAKKRTLSQGYGFVQFYKEATVKHALIKLQNSLLDGHNLSLKRSEKTLSNDIKGRRNISLPQSQQESTKILVKNIPFQSTVKEVRLLFKAFGELKSVRLPEKPGSKEHRGFGFVEFTTRTDAKAAFETLGGSTHLYGRRLVLEWAKEDETVEELRVRTAEHFMATGPKKKKLKLDEDVK